MLVSEFSPCSAVQVCEILSANTSLVNLDLGYNSFDEAALLALARGVVRNATLLSLEYR